MKRKKYIIRRKHPVRVFDLKSKKWVVTAIGVSPHRAVMETICNKGLLRPSDKFQVNTATVSCGQFIALRYYWNQPTRRRNSGGKESGSSIHGGGNTP